MATGRRIKRLREMLDQIERLPSSPDRDRLLSEVRSRAVDVDTGETPRAMLPLREPAPMIFEPSPLARERAATVKRMVPPPPAPVIDLARPAFAADHSTSLEDSFWVGERLSLEDTLQLSPLPHIQAQGGRPIPPWTLGLRG